MDKIVNYNCEGLCVHRYCDNRYTHVIYTEIYGLPVALAFCEKHAEEIDEFRLNNYRMVAQ